MDEMAVDNSEIQHFSFSGGWLCLDFCNTADGDINHEWTENLTSYADLVAWGWQAGMLSEDEAAHLLDEAARRPAQAARALEAAKDLRFTIYRIFSAVAGKRAPQPADMEALNAALSEAMRRLQVAVTPAGFAWDWDARGDVLGRVMWPVIRSAAELLVSDKLDLVRECAGNGCTWLFLDTSRNHSRRWCDMKSCGNRAKARRHYERVRVASAEEK